MVTIEERLSEKLPNITSLFFKLPFINKTVEESLQQLPLVKLDKKTLIYEIPITKLFYIITLLNKYDSVKFIPYKEPTKEHISCAKYNFKLKPYQHQLEAIEYGLNHEG